MKLSRKICILMYRSFENLSIMFELIFCEKLHKQFQIPSCRKMKLSSILIHQFFCYIVSHFFAHKVIFPQFYHYEVNIFIDKGFLFYMFSTFGPNSFPLPQPKQERQKRNRLFFFLFSFNAWKNNFRSNFFVNFFRFYSSSFAR